MASRYPVIVGGVDITAMIEVDSYETALIPVYGGSVTTLDGVEHTTVIREKGYLKFSVNPMTDVQTKKLNDAMKNSIAEVQYHCTLRNATVIATMRIGKPAARHMGRVNYGGGKWNELAEITMTEL